MALKDGFRIKETSTTTGTGTLTLAGAPASFRTFLAEVGEGNTCWYQLFDGNGTGWEVGLGTITGAALSRDTIIASSNSNAAITLTAGTHTIVNAPVPSKATGDSDFGNTEQDNLLLVAYNEKLPTPASVTGTLTIDLSLGRTQSAVLTENTTLAFSNPPVSGVAAAVTLKLAQDATGSRTFTFPASVKYSGGTAPTLSSAASEYDWLTFVTVDGGTTYDLFVGGQAFA